MSAKDLATTAVENGMSIRRAAKEYGIHFSTLQYHLDLQKRVSSTDSKQKESLIATAIESVDSKRLSIFGAARHYGIPYKTLHRRMKNRCPEVGRPTKFTKEEEAVLVDILMKLAKLNVGLTKPALIRLLAKIGEIKGKV